MPLNLGILKDPQIFNRSLWGSKLHFRAIVQFLNRDYIGTDNLKLNIWWGLLYKILRLA